jgi:glycerol-3-phosphate dehydrogenase
MSPLSRNRQAGKYLAEGHTKGMITQVLMHMVVESFSTLEALPYLLGTEKQEYPLLSGAMEISEGKRAVQELCTFF